MLSSQSVQSSNCAYESLIFSLSLSRNYISEEIVDAIINNSSNSTHKLIIELHYALHNFLIAYGYVHQRASLIKKPTTVLHLSDNYLCPLNDAKLLRSKIPRSKIIISDKGHSSVDA